ncbi:MAG: phage tail tape measure C-terminal domain-containing protein [Candidatus Thiodiazotropha sp. 6PLUC6]
MAFLKLAGIVVDLSANSAQYVKELQVVNRKTRSWSKDVNQSFTRVTRNLAGMAAGFVGISVAVAQFNKSLRKAREMENLSRLAGQSVEEFQAAAYATDRYGISAENLGDISKDVSDKLGDFIATGGGEFKDFFEQVAPKVGLTAEALQNLSGPEVLLRVKKAMDDANVPMKQQVFYLEAIANDATLLMPLLENNGEAYHRLAKEARDANVIISQTDISALRESDEILNRTGLQISTSFAKGAAGAAEQIEWLGDLISNAFEYWGSLLDTWTDQPKTLAGMIKRGAELQEELDSIESAINRLEGNESAYNRDSRLAAMNAQAVILKNEIKELSEARWEKQTGKPETRPQPTVPLIASGTGDLVQGVTKSTDDIIKQNQRMLDSLTRSLATREELIELDYKNQVEQINALVLTEEQIKKAGFDNLLQLQSAYLLQAKAARQESLDSLKTETEQATDVAASQFDKLAAAIGANTDAIENAATGWANSFSTELASMVTQGELDFGRLATSIVNDLIRIAIQAQITQPLLQAMGLAPTPTEAKATGGPVSRGSTYLVGEKGPELFTASNSGNITPNNQLGGSTQVNIYTQPGETAETKTRQSEQGDIVEVFMKQVDSRMNEQISRGQGLARTLEGRYSLSRKSY